MAKKTPPSPVIRATTTAKEIAALIHALTRVALAIPLFVGAVAFAVHVLKVALQ
jgi:hypothetical protein